MVVVRREGAVLTVAENGFGKRTLISDYPVRKRGGKGVITMKISARNGDVLVLKEVVESDELMFISRKGLIIRQAAKDISVIGRNTQGVRLMHLGEGDRVVDVAHVAEKELVNGLDEGAEESGPEPPEPTGENGEDA
jgi:DNA gyrase subunit A